MQVIVPCETRCTLSGGRPACPHNTYERLWKRYLEVFDSVTVVARLFPREDSNAAPIEGPGVRFVAVPPYTNPRGYLRSRREMTRIFKEICTPDSAYILFIPGAVGHLMAEHLRGRRIRYSVEVHGDPYDSMAPGANSHPLRPFWRWWFSRELRSICCDAAAASYVTESALQRRYPCPAKEVGVSDVVLPDEDLVEQPRCFEAASQRRRLVMVGGLSQLYKAPDILIRAVAKCIHNNIDVELVFVGDGKFTADLQKLAADLGISDRVIFRGRVSGGKQVYAELDAADVFVLASYQEGLPRAMVEAMARGLPCIGSEVGGIPELLHGDDLVPPGSPDALAAKICEVVADPSRLQRMSERNLQRARDYRNSVLHEKRLNFLKIVRKDVEMRTRSSATAAAAL